MAFFRRDYKRVAELHIESGWVAGDPRQRPRIGDPRRVRALFRPSRSKEISLGMVLMRLFQTSRRFQVEIQPQWCCCKNPAQHRRAGSPARPGARPLEHCQSLFWRNGCLSRWARNACGASCRAEAPHYAKLVPELPRLLYDFLSRRPADVTSAMRDLLEAQSAPIGCCKASFTAAWALCWVCW